MTMKKQPFESMYFLLNMGIVQCHVSELRGVNYTKDGSLKGKHYIYIIYIYMGSGRFPGPMELLLQQLVRVSKTR